MELASAAYSVLAIRAFWKFLEEKNYGYVALGILLISILAQVKNEGFVIYMPGVVIWFLIVLALQKRVKEFFKGLFKDKKNVWSSIGYVVYFMLPFLVIRMVNGLGLNPVSWAPTAGKIFHPEVFNVLGPIFVKQDNYNIILWILFVLGITVAWKSLKKKNIWMPIISAIIIFGWFALTFFFTENYQWALTQTTINRVFTMCFVVILAFIWIIMNSYESKEN